MAMEFLSGGDKKILKLIVVVIVQLNTLKTMKLYTLGELKFEIQIMVSTECILLSYYHKVKTS